MEMLPDYPTRVVEKHRARVDRVSLIFQFLLISIGAWWIFSSFGNQNSSLARFGLVAVLFSSALLMPDLVEFGPVQRTRISTACCIAWPPILSFAEVNRSEGGNLEGVILLVLVSVVLYSSSRHILRLDVNSRRWRGLMTTLGFGLALPIVLASSNSESFIFIGIPALLTTIPSLFTKDGLEGERQAFSERLKTAETRILELQSGNNLLQQPNSLLKTAREEGWKNPKKGIELVNESEREVERILSFLSDIEEIKNQSMGSIDRAEKITGRTGVARTIFDSAIAELENGSLRISENKFREAKSKAENLEDHWQSAKDAIKEAEKAISTSEGHLVSGLLSTLEDAKRAMMEENPEYALSIVSEIPSQMGDVEGLMDRAKTSLEDARNEISSSDSGSITELNKRLEEANDALEAGNASLAIGLSDGVTRTIRRESAAKTSVQRALRQRKSIEGGIPVGEGGSEWRERLDEIASFADSGNWVEADDSMQALTSELENHSSRIREAREMLDFLGDDWTKLRNRLDSSGIPPESEGRVGTERSLTDSEKALSEGRVDSCLKSLAKADSYMEALRRLV
jgi:hypothetical protein